MTRLQAAQYARECATAKRQGQTKPPRPDEAATITALTDVSRTIITTRTTLTLLNAQMEMIVDYMDELKQRSPQARAYSELVNNIWGSMMDLEKELKMIR